MVLEMEVMKNSEKAKYIFVTKFKKLFQSMSFSV